MDERTRDFLAVIGYVYLQHGDAESAAAVLEPVLAARPHDRGAARLLAYAFLQRKRFRECLELTDFLLNGHGSQEPSYVWLFRCRALYGLGRHEEARRLWEQTRKGKR
jgi:tetratricopeptide (TPR) repeat protein